MPDNAITESWWLMLLRGILAIVFGFFAFASPGVALASLILVFGAFALVEGTLATVYAIRTRKSDQDWWLVLIEGLLGIAFGVLAFFNPFVTTLVLLFYIAAWAIVGGALRIAEAIRLRRQIRGEAWLILSGIISVVFGVLMMAFPGAGALAALFYIGIWALLGGVALVFLAFRLRSHQKQLGAGRGDQPRISVHAH